MTASGPAITGAKLDRAAAFRALADQHLDAAYRLAHAILRDPTEAQDATHDAFVTAWRSWDSLRDVRRFEAWFDKIVINSCRNRQRRARRWPTTDISDEVALHSGDQFVQSIERDVIRGALESLSPEQQVIVALRFYRDLTVPQIAARLDIPTGTAQSRLHYALRRLQAVMDAGDRGQAATEETVR